jgi:hypothetical protein
MYPPVAIQTPTPTPTPVMYITSRTFMALPRK